MVCAIAKHDSIETAAVRAIEAGCDVLLICGNEALQTQAHQALVARAGDDAAFFARCQQAAERSLRIRRLCPPRLDGTPASLGGSAALVAEIERRVPCS